jgi:hypothetical protein
MRMGFTCWKCGSRATSVKLRSMSPTLMEAGYRCRNIDCGHTFVVALEAIRTLNPGAYPSPPGIVVPLSKHVRRTELLSQLQALPEAKGGAIGDVSADNQIALALDAPGGI